MDKSNKKEGTMQVVEYDITIAAIQEMKSKYVDLVITDVESYDTVRLAIADVREKRVAVEAKRKELKSDALAYGKRVDSTAKEITAKLLEIEDPLKAEKKKEDDRKEAIREAKAQKEAKRVEKIKEHIMFIRSHAEPYFLFDKSSNQIKNFVSFLMDTEITPEVHQEFEAEARQVLTDTINTLEDAYEARIKFDQEEIERKAEAERLEKQKKEQEVAQAKIDEENRKIQEQKDRLEKKKRADELKKRQDEFERQATIKAEQEAKDKVEHEERSRKLKIEAEEKEKQRKAAMAPDREKLYTFTNQIDEDNLDIPKLISKEAQEILKGALQDLFIIGNDIRRKADKL